MISKKSYKFLVWTCQFLGFLRCLPAHWDPETMSFVPFLGGIAAPRKRDILLNSVVFKFIVLGHIIVFVLFTGIIFLGRGIRLEEVVVGIMCICICVLSLQLQLGANLNTEVSLYQLNSLYAINEKYGKSPAITIWAH